MSEATHTPRARRRPPTELHTHLELEVSLLDISPPIWRRFLLKPAATFYHLGDAINRAGPWSCRDGWAFGFYERPERDTRGCVGTDSRWSDRIGEEDHARPKQKIADWFVPGGREACYYLYDADERFVTRDENVDNKWWHEVRFRGVVSHRDRFRRRLLGGARAFPPDDLGGRQVYERCVRIARGGINDGGLAGWLDGWHPDAFDLDERRYSFERE